MSCLAYSGNMSLYVDLFGVHREYNSDCGYCSCECLSSKNTSVKITSIPRVKKYKTIKERNSSANRQSPSKVNKKLSHSVDSIHRNVYPETVELCESMHNLCMLPRVFEAYNKVSTHDQKILNRMAEKRSQKIARVENSWLAQKMWQNEKYERELMKYKQEESYKKALREKQALDSRLLQTRFDEILRNDQLRLEELKRSLALKDMFLEERLEKLRYQREAQIANRHYEESRKFANIMRAIDENILKDEIRKQNINHHLENRLSRADATRKHYMDAYKRRLKTDNYREQALHKENYYETLRFENYQLDQLQDRIAKKDKKVEKFLEQKRQNNTDSVERARLASSLRELVRRSISPDSFQFNTGRLLNERPISNLSILSSFKLG